MQWARRAADAADAKKGENIIILDMRDVTLVADYFVIVSGHNVIQVQSIADAIDEALGQENLKLLNRSRRDKSGWTLLDFGSIVVHVFTDEQRAYYNLERLWGDALPVEWSPKPSPL